MAYLARSREPSTISIVDLEVLYLYHSLCRHYQRRRSRDPSRTGGTRQRREGLGVRCGRVAIRLVCACEVNITCGEILVCKDALEHCEGGFRLAV